MKKTIIFLIISILVVASLICGITIYTKYKNDIILSTNTVTTNATSQIKDIDWGTYDSNDITLSKSIEITEPGTYTLTGTIDNGLIKVNTNGNVKLILNGVNITNSSGPAIYIENADNVEIYTVKGTTNTLSDGTNYSGYGEDVNATIYSKDDLILSGEGTLKINANYNDAIASKDDLKITGGIYDITSKDDGIRGKDSVEITGGTITIKSKGDAIKSTNDTDDGKGFILISGGEFNLTSGNDGLDAASYIVIKDGTLNITSGGGAKGTTVKTGGPDERNTKNTNTESTKAIKAENNIVIEGGIIIISSLDDGIHSNGDIGISGGTITIKSDDDGIHADGLILISDGNIDITSAECIEGTYVKINGGNIKISASDDGINAGNKSNAYKVTIEINGGNITINMGQGDTDAIDSNGNLYINGGTLNITGQSPFDYDGEAKYSGGEMIANGAKTTTITNQFAGGGGNMSGGNNGNPQENGNMQDRRGGMVRQR